MSPARAPNQTAGSWVERTNRASTEKILGFSLHNQVGRNASLKNICFKLSSQNSVIRNIN